MKAAIYSRVSTEEQARGGVSLDMQEDRCRQAALAAGAETVELFCDDGYSGTTRDRPALQEFLDRLDEFDSLYVWKLDRLSRSVRDWANLMDTLSQHDVGFVSVTEGFDFSTSVGKAMMGMLAVFAELFVDILRENIRAALRHRAEQGLWHGQPPLGYDWDRDSEGQPISSAALCIVPEEAEIIRRLFNFYARGGTLKTTGYYAMEQDWQTKRGKSLWRPDAIRRILGNTTYIGMMEHDGELYEGLHEPIVGPALWASAQRRLAARAQRHPRSLGSSLSPILYCSICGGSVKIVSGPSAAHPGVPERYGCGHRRLLPPSERHEPVGGTRPKIEAVIWAYTRHLLGADILRARVDKYVAAQREAEADSEAGRVREELAAVEQKIGLTAEYGLRNLLPPDMLEQQQRPLLERREALRASLGRLEGTGASLTAKEIRWLRGVSEEAVSRLQGADYGRQVEFLGRLYDHIDLWRGRLVFHHRVALPPKTVPLPHYYAPKRGHRIIIPPD